MKHLFFLFAALGIYSSVHGCSCAPAWDARGFCEVLANAKNKPMFCLVKARILSWYHWGMYVEVLDNIYNTATSDTVLVWGDNGACCRPTFTGFADFHIGDTLVMSLEQTDLMGNFIAPGLPDYENPLDYVLQGCGAYYMKYNMGNVTGWFDDYITMDTIAYETFKNEVKDCFNIAAGIAPGSKTTHSVSVYPNPADTKVMVSAPQIINELALINCIGECVYCSKPFSSNTFINVYGLAAGIYTLVVYSGEKPEISHHRIIGQ